MERCDIDTRYTSVSAGIQLEGRIQRLLLNQGYFAIRDIFIPGYYQARGATQPDIDVLGYKFTHDFVPTKVIYDCKSGASGAVNRVLWLQTLARRINANRTYMVRRDTKKDIKYYALAEDVRFIDYGTLDNLEQASMGTPSIVGSTSTQYLAATVEVHRLAKKSEIDRALRLIHTDFWFLPSCAAVKRVISQYERIGAIGTLPGLSPVGLQWLKAVLITLFTLAVVRIASEVISLAQNEREELLKQRLVSDKIPYGEFASIVRTSFEFAHSIYGKPQGLPLGKHSEIPPPPYTASLLDLIARAIAHPAEAVLMPLFSECVLFDFVLDSKAPNRQILEGIFHISYDRLLSHYRDYVFFLSNVCPGIRDFLSRLLPT